MAAPHNPELPLNLRAAALALLVPLCAFAQDEEKPVDKEGSKDHPAVKRYPGSIIEEFSEAEFETMKWPTGADPDGNTLTREVEGKYFNAFYSFPPKASCTQILRNYENAFKAAGLKLGRKGTDDPWQKSWMDQWVTAEGKANGKGPKLYVVVSCTGDHGHILVTEEGEMAQKVEIDSGAMADEILKSGRIALYGVNFATGKAEITPDSAKTLEQIAKLLVSKPDWKLRVEGHTDNVGRSAANLDLSKKRAAAVKDQLVKKHGVAAARLTSEGYGDSKPVAPNTTDEGKAKNRRVELSKL